jgi:hypothetical protein
LTPVIRLVKPREHTPVLAQLCACGDDNACRRPGVIVTSPSSGVCSFSDREGVPSASSRGAGASGREWFDRAARSSLRRTLGRCAARDWRPLYVGLERLVHRPVVLERHQNLVWCDRRAAENLVTQRRVSWDQGSAAGVRPFGDGDATDGCGCAGRNSKTRVVPIQSRYPPTGINSCLRIMASMRAVRSRGA